MKIKGDDKRDIRKTESMIGASRSSKREKGRTNKPISRSKNPGLLAMSKTAKGKEAVKKIGFTLAFFQKLLCLALSSYLRTLH